MGNGRSVEAVDEEDIWWTNGEKHQQKRQKQRISTIQHQHETNSNNEHKKVECSETTTSSDREQRKKELEEDFIKFKQELARKHERRRQLIEEKKKEMMDLRNELIKEKEENERLKRSLEENQLMQVDNINKSVQNESSISIVNNLKEENEDLRNEVEKLKLILKEKEFIADKNKELRISLAELQMELQNVNTQVITFEKERIDYQEHVTALKDIIRVTKEMLRIREDQIEELRKKISSIEDLLASKEVSILSDDLRQEYERQLRNIRDLRNLYEERQRVDKHEKQKLQSQIDELKKSIEHEQNKNGELNERINELEEDNSKKYDKIVNLESSFGLAKAECKELHGEMNIINQLFSQILISFNNDQDIDLNNMIKILEENHDLLTNIVINDESSETSALPKVLLDLVNQVNENKKDNKDAFSNLEHQQEANDKLDIIQEEEESQLPGMHQLNSPEEIVENLPKVWRVLIELLSHQCAPNNEITEKKGENDSHYYKSVETPTGLRQVLSVSKTFIRLKSLILEKKAVEKEMTRLKQLNTHLEGRLSDQEKRLLLVSNELSKTWNFVGKMQKQHQQLHTQEKILRYELAQKRKLLTELKEELEYCRQKWSQARKQNSSTEEQWKQLRTEFTSRKRSTTDDINNSIESGYSDDKSSSDEDDAGFDDKTQAEEETSSEKLNNLSENDAHLFVNLHNSEFDSKIDQDQITNSDNINIENKVIAEEDVSNENIEHTAVVDIVNSEITNNEQISLDVQSSVLPNSTNSVSCDLHSLEAKKTDIQEEKHNIKRQNENSKTLLNASASLCQETLTETKQNISTDECLLVYDSQQNSYQENNANNNYLTENLEASIPMSSNPLESMVSTKGCVEKTEDKTLDLTEQCCSSNLENNKNADLETPGTSHKNPAQAAEEFAARREERMKRLEEQCNELFFSVAKTSLRGLVMSHKLDNLHEMYGDNSQTADENDSSTEENQIAENDNSFVNDSTENESNHE